MLDHTPDRPVLGAIVAALTLALTVGTGCNSSLPDNPAASAACATGITGTACVECCRRNGAAGRKTDTTMNHGGYDNVCICVGTGH